MTSYTFVCVWAGTKYSPEYVRYLSTAIQQYSGQREKLVCFTDLPRSAIDGVEFRQLPSLDLPNAYLWWHKPYIFSRESGLSGRCVYFDLDVLIARPLDQLLSLPGSFLIPQDFTRSFRKNITGSNSSLMIWDHADYQHIWQQFSQDPAAVISRYRGDQDFISHVIGTRKTWIPKSWVCSYKWEWLTGPEFQDPTVIVFHGEPKTEQFAFSVDIARQRLTNK
jgi:hypothetical protein